MVALIVNGATFQQERQGNAAVQTIAAPVGGWNTRDARSAMDGLDALILDNMVPNVAEPDSRQGSLTSRPGYASHSTGITGNVETLAEFHAGTTRKLISAAGTKINDSTAATTATELASGFTNARWQTTNFGRKLVMVNGEDAPQLYDGSTVSASGHTGSGLTAANLIHVNNFKNRLYFVEANTSNYWYGGVDEITGTLSKVDLSYVCKRGGNLQAIATITRDGGSGADDLIAFIMTTGEVLIYQGSDPSDATDWSLVGSYKIGEPIGRRCYLELAGDVLVITTSGFIFLSEEMQKTEVATEVPKITGAANDAAKNYKSNYGWEPIFYPRRNLVLVNIPLTTNTTYHQYVMNTVNRAPARFKNINARCWGLYNTDLYFGGNGVVYKFDGVLSDAENDILIDLQWAFNTFGSPAKKQFMEAIVILDADGNVTFTADMAYDYGGALNSQPVDSVSTGTPWGSPWGSPWSPENVTRTDTFPISGDGRAASLRLRASLNGQRVSIHGATFSYEIESII